MVRQYALVIVHLISFLVKYKLAFRFPSSRNSKIFSKDSWRLTMIKEVLEIFFCSRMNFGDRSWPCFQVMLKIEMKAFDFGEEINPLHVENDAK